jgi:hypothetical protein
MYCPLTRKYCYDDFDKESARCVFNQRDVTEKCLIVAVLKKYMYGEKELPADQLNATLITSKCVEAGLVKEIMGRHRLTDDPVQVIRFWCEHFPYISNESVLCCILFYDQNGRSLDETIIEKYFSAERLKQQSGEK